ncbi:MAG: MFS transporter [Desulfarculales bacterium]|jgi:OFA family oxalate/formate antiporter-like MFS transporter|nr:MFS transporter [Desulfarculales bacterium]
MKRPFISRRVISLAASMLASLLVGIAYSWSVYVNPLALQYGWSEAQISLAYTVNVTAMALAPVLCAPLRARLSISAYTLAGAAVYGGGIVLSGFISGSIYELYLYFGVMTGSGIGIVYLSLASYVVRLFPERKGLAAGLYTACYGCGALFWAPLASHFIAAHGISWAFRCLGIFFFLALLLVTRFLHEIPAEETEVNRAGQAPVKSGQREYSPRDLVLSPTYYVIIVIYACGLSSGMMLMSLGSPIIQGSLGYSPESAAVLVGLFAPAQTLGRLLWGWISDSWGRCNVLALVSLFSSLGALLLALTEKEIIFLIALFSIPLCYGAYASLLSPLAVETFGVRHFAMNYNLLFLSFALAALMGPQVAAYVKSSFGGYQGAFAGVALFSALAFIFTLILRRRRAGAS